MNENDQPTNDQRTCEQEELWYRVPGFDAEVYVSNQGQVLVDGKVRKLDPHNPGGYFRVEIDGKKYGVHQLLGFVIRREKRQDGLVPHHINGDSQDNTFENICLVSAEINTRKSNDRKLINRVIRHAIDNGDSRFTYLANIEQRYLEAEFNKRDGNKNDLAEILSEYIQNGSLSRRPISDLRFMSPNRDNYKGITRQEVEARLMMKNKTYTKLPKLYHRDNAVKNFLLEFKRSHQQEIRLNAEVARSVLIDRVSTLCTAVSKVIQKHDLGHRLKVENRDASARYLIKI